mmetsp:Transcript_25839/g.43585  ORF Transcript_25839/g.43585 Transcript_25839/m.43585 type:complete len:525 (+) Transcript_25839:87-1661(+)
MSSLLHKLLVATSVVSVLGQTSYYNPNIKTDGPADFHSVFERKVAYDYGGESDGFGKSVAVHGNTMLIGSCFSDTHGSQGGNAHIFTLDTGDTPSSTNGWKYVTSLNANDTYPYDFFGWDVALSYKVAAVGAWQADDPLENTGAVYIFESASSGEWSSYTILRGTYASEYFGISVALDWDGSVLLVGAAGHPSAEGETGGYGAVYAFRKGNNGAWHKKSLMLAQDGGSKYDYFGISVALEGRIGVVGAYGSDPGTGESAGSAYVVNGDNQGNNWLVVQKLVASDSDQNSFFGRKVALRNGTMVIGADGDSEAAPSAGAVYIFRQGSNSGNWKEKQKITPESEEGYDLFGTSVALWGNHLVVGAAGAIANNVKSGSVHIYESDSDGKNWALLTTLSASDASSSDKYGASVAIHGDVILVGAELADGFDYNSGAVYAYTTVPDYFFYFDPSLSSTELSLLTVGAFLFSAAVVLWAFKSGKLNSVVSKDCYFGAMGHNPDFDASRRGDFEMADDSAHSSSSRQPLRS